MIAGGSIHVYGSVARPGDGGRFRQAARAHLLPQVEAELLAIDGLYMTADEIEANMRGPAIQAWLENDALKITNLD